MKRVYDLYFLNIRSKVSREQSVPWMNMNDIYFLFADECNQTFNIFK